MRTQEEQDAVDRFEQMQFVQNIFQAFAGGSPNTRGINAFLRKFLVSPDALYSEPALAAAVILSYYWQGMYASPMGDLDEMHKDIERVAAHLHEWVDELQKP